MKKLLIFYAFFMYSISFSQVAMGKINPDPHAQLDVSATQKGILIPRIELQSKMSPLPINPDPSALRESLLVFNMNDTADLDKAYYYWNGTKWNKVIIEDNLETLFKSPWNKEGTTTPAILNTDNIYQKGKVGIGEVNMTPKTWLDVRGDALINGVTVGKGNTNIDTNTAMGISALASTTGSNNTAAGYQTLFSNTTGLFNTANGVEALYYNTVGTQNTATGSYALYVNTAGHNNTANGCKALRSNTAGNSNIATGAYALYSNTLGSGNTASGSYALKNNTTGSNNVAIGNNSGPSSNNLSNTIAIGYNAEVTTSNTIRLGNDFITHIYAATATITSSDRRWKENIKTIPLGLDFINKVHPVEYIRKNNDDRTKEWGVIAQELQQTIEDVGYQNAGIVQEDNTPNKYLSVRYTDLIAPLIKAVQELSKENEDLKKKNDQIENQIDKLKEIIKKMNLI